MLTFKLQESSSCIAFSLCILYQGLWVWELSHLVFYLILYILAFLDILPYFMVPLSTFPLIVLLQCQLSVSPFLFQPTVIMSKANKFWWGFAMSIGSLAKDEMRMILYGLLNYLSRYKFALTYLLYVTTGSADVSERQKGHEF